MTSVTVIKRNHLGDELWRYTGLLIDRAGNTICLEAPFNGKKVAVMGTTIKRGDLFFETYYTDRWYNVYEIHDREDGGLKGWYCNIGKPAVMEGEDLLSYVDLALDLWVAPDGKQTVLDEDEFLELDLDPGTRAQALDGMKELQMLFQKKGKPGAN
jgi:predicted RNA-binding protein associated with RNAse of E/G family